MKKTLRFLVYVACCAVWMGGVFLVARGLVEGASTRVAEVYHWDPKSQSARAEAHRIRRSEGLREVVRLYLLGPMGHNLRRSQGPWIRCLSATKIRHLLVLNLSKETYELGSAAEERRFLRNLALTIRANDRSISELAFFVEGKRLERIQNGGYGYKERNPISSLLGEGVGFGDGP